MTAPNIDFLTAATTSWRLAESDAELARAGTEALLGIGQQLRRIADQMEPPDPDAAMRAYLAREGRL